MLNLRLLFGTIMVVALVAILVVDQWFAPVYPCFALSIGVIVSVAALELTRLFSSLSVRVHGPLCSAGCLILVLSNWPALISERFAQTFPNFTLPFLVFVALGMLTFLGIGLRYKGPGDSVRRIEAHLFIFFYIGCLGSFVVQTRWLGETPGVGALTFFLCVFTAKVCDIGAFFTGRSFGKHKLAPALSPGKTWEGLLGGVVAGVVLAIACVSVGEWALGQRVLSLPIAALFGLIIAVVGQVGDLMESLIKRDCGQKDASAKIPGFGGLLDVIDSILFSGPVAYALLRVLGL